VAVKNVNKIDARVKVVKRRADFVVDVGQLTESQILIVGGKLDETRAIFLDARSCLQSSEGLCAQAPLQNGMEAFSGEVALPASTTLLSALARGRTTISALNAALRRSQNKIKGIAAGGIQEVTAEIRKAFERLDKWTPFLNDAMKVLNHKICIPYWPFPKKKKCFRVKSIFEGVTGKLLKKFNSLAAKLWDKLPMPDIDIIDIPLAEKLGAFDVYSAWPSELDDKNLNTALGINFQQLQQLALDFSYGWDLDRACQSVGDLLLKYGPTSGTTSDGITAVESDLAAQKKDSPSWKPEPPALNDLGASLLTSRVFQAFEPTDICFFLPYREALECLGLSDPLSAITGAATVVSVLPTIASTLTVVTILLL